MGRMHALAGRPAFQMQLRPDDLFLTGQQIVRHKLGLHVLKSKSADGIREAFSRPALFPEQQDRLFQYGKHFFFA